MENGDGLNPTISADDVISKLKDDGDFDRLRLKLVRKLKENEELRNSIISVVRQSAALNRPGAENMKPRQLSDAIHSEVGEKVMGQISDGIWDIIRSGEDMKTEISETVKSVYCKLSNPQGNGHGQQSLPSETVPAVKGPVNNGPNQVNGRKESPEFCHSSNTLDHNESKGTPGYSCNNNPLAEINNDKSKGPPGFANDVSKGPPGFAKDVSKGPPGFAKDVLKGPPGFAKDVSKGPPGFAKDVSKGPPGFAKDASKGPPGFAKDASKGPPGFAKDASKGPPGFANDESKGPSGFADSNVHLNNKEEGLPLETQKGEPHRLEDEDLSGPPGYSAPVSDHKQTTDGSDDDPELPPGFGG